MTNSGSLRKHAYEKIKRKVITHKYEPGSYISEATICKELDLGRTPVHEALKQLGHEGLIEILPRKGAIVRPLGINEIKDIIEVRTVNESLCAALAAERATENNIEEMRAILEPAKSLIEQGNHEALMDLDLRFHQAIAETAGNQVLAEILVRLHERALRFWFVALRDVQQLRNVQHEHIEIFNSIASRDPEASKKAIRNHIESFRQTIIMQIVP